MNRLFLFLALSGVMITGCGMFEPIPGIISATYKDGTRVPAAVTLTAGQEITIEVTAIFPWIVEKCAELPAWLSVTPKSGCVGTQEVTIKVTEELLGAQYTILFLAGIERLRLTVKQPAATFTVTYDANGGGGTPPTDDNEYALGEEVTVKEQGAITAPDNHAFAGWNTQADGSGDFYDEGDTFTITGNTIFYAYFEEIGSSAKNPILINDETDLRALATDVNAGDNKLNKHYKLINDILLTGDWTPIGNWASNNSNYHFCGTFDGNGKEIHGLSVTGDNDYAGLFGVIGANGTVTSLGVSGTVNGASNVGGIAGLVNNNGKIEHCWASVSVSGTGSNIGGVAGTVRGTVTNCYATGAVSGTNSVGGVAGYVGGALTNCYATGDVTGNDNVGGVAGYVFSGTLTNCAALNPNVSGNNGVERVVGNFFSATISNNVAWVGMSGSFDGYGENGADISSANISVDGTIGDRFTNANGWTTANGKLPGLFGNTVTLPTHLRQP